jgi:uncharacterized protein
MPDGEMIGSGARGHGGPLDIAVIGTGIAGLACAWLLSSCHRVTVYESAERVGGHANTVEVATRAGRLPVDTGFIVYNETTYPNLTALFRHLGVKTQLSDMSFAVSLDAGRLEYAGTDLRGLFAQKRNLLRPRFWRMLRDLLRFYRSAPADLARLDRELGSLDEYLRAGGYGAALRDDHLLPMSAAIWSCAPEDAGRQPAASFIRFCDNHGLLQVSDRPVWRTVLGGSREYLARLTETFADRIHTNRAALAVERCGDGVRVRTSAGCHDYDHAVLACHADQALGLLGGGATRRERAVLGAFRYTRNLAVLHTDESLMPRRRSVWASWNYLGRSGGRAPDAVMLVPGPDPGTSISVTPHVGGMLPGSNLRAARDARVEPRHDDRGHEHDLETAVARQIENGRRPCVTYWMNRLQRLPGDTEYFVTLNPPRAPRPGTLLRGESYEHPMFDAAAVRAQRQLWSLQGNGGVWFCGAHFGAGFHEDGLQAGLAVAEQLGGVRRPWTVANESGRIHLSTADVNTAELEISG